MSQASYTAKPAQIIEGQYLDPQKLIRLLEEVYGTSSEGKNNFRVELRLNRYKIYHSQNVTDAGVLTEAQIRDCRAYGRLWD
ncbi:hypothetical protein K432DRAFT_430468 [Lepidopterella palustris CBS 459.81]|uniref:Uncharacterized protein n=1 Tax=Lepidopterella palustris CBS 459.81 TaxID=1314670 RepID=A0A8E2DXY3_9PEZI|nr:hypothetical protein K432DRAFT_430468 [Lepidopterella palustris CBS 459.81]